MRVRQSRGGTVFTGLLFLALGIILLLDNFNLIDARPLLSQWWPALFILIGLKTLIIHEGSYAWIGALFWIAVGALFLSSTLGFVSIALPTLMWPLILIWLGVYTIVGTRCGSYSRHGGQS
jgi:hypothetical protein